VFDLGSVCHRPPSKRVELHQYRRSFYRGTSAAAFYHGTSTEALHLRAFRQWRAGFVLAALVAGAPLCGAATSTQPAPRLVHFAPVGDTTLYVPTHVDAQTDVVLFASGDGGWNKGVVEMAERLRQRGKIVAGFSTPEFLRRLNAASADGCAYPPQQLEQLSQFVQHTLALPVYRTPMLMGYSSGASLAYLTLAQTPINTFVGGIGLGFCPELNLTRPVCRQGALTVAPTKTKHGIRLDPVPRLAAPLTILQGEIDQVCNVAEISAFGKQVSNVTLRALPKVGHGFGVYANWFPQMLDAYAAIAAGPKPVGGSNVLVDGLPLIESRATATQSTLVVLVSGDGGWSSLMQAMTHELNRRGYAVIGLNALKYFWNAKTPAQASADLARIIERYRADWHCSDVVLGGYSMGADVLPGMVVRLPRALRTTVRGVTLLAPGRATDFAFHFEDWLERTPAAATPILPDAAALAREVPLTCLYGEREADQTLCTVLPAHAARVIALPGAHHFDGRYVELADQILLSLGNARS
jgi:type IV secretory pathway VirJ component